MKLSVEIGHGWCAAQSQCTTCGHEFLLIRERSRPPWMCECPNCKDKSNVINLELPWSGLMEDIIHDECTE